MQIIEPKVELVTETGYKKIERAGRICYKSEDKITETSHQQFIKNIISRGHDSVLAHESLILHLGTSEEHREILRKIILNTPLAVKDRIIPLQAKNGDVFIVGNIRAWREVLSVIKDQQLIKTFKNTYSLLFFDFEDYDVEVIEDAFTPISGVEFDQIQALFLMRESFYFRFSRASSHQLVRHTGVEAISQASQRYCNYSKSKFENSINFIQPEAFKSADRKVQISWLENRVSDEREYMAYISAGIKPEDARSCLPNATATEMIVTAHLSEWLHIINARTDSHAQHEIRTSIEQVKLLLQKKYEDTELEKLFV